MHQLMGYTLDEWAAMLTILTIIIGFLLWLLNQVIKNGTGQLSKSMDHLIEQIRQLNKSIGSVQITAKETRQQLDDLQDQFEEHIGEAKVRNQRITSLEHAVYNRKCDK